MSSSAAAYDAARSLTTRAHDSWHCECLWPETPDDLMLLQA